MIVRKLEALFTLNTNAVQFKKAASELDKLASKAETVMKAIAGYWAVSALQNFVVNIANGMDEIGKKAQYLGIGTDALQEFHYAAQKSGVSLDAIDDALKEIQVRATDAKSGTGEAAEAFQLLGLKSTDAAGRIREPIELLYAVADAIKALPTHSERIWVADAIFGDEGSMVLKMLKEGSLGLQQMRKEAQVLGLTLGSDSIAKANRFNQALKKLQYISSRLAKTFVEFLLPPLSWLMEKCAALSAAFNQTAARTSLVRVTLTTLGLSLTALSIKLTALAVKSSIAFGPMILMAAAFAAGITAIALIIDDLWVAFKSGDSVVGATFSKMLQWSAITADGLKKGFIDAWQSITQEFAKFSDWINKGLTSLAHSAKNLLANLFPDFLKNGFVATMKMIGGFNGQESSNFNHQLAKSLSSVSHQNRILSNQNVNVAVNVKSQAHPQEIGSEVSKAVRQALERERFNAFIGVSQYAG
jgi:hypothetical protein